MSKRKNKTYIFTGVPGSGKSTLSELFAKEYSFKRISKDEEQLKLFKKNGFNSSIEKKALVKEADEIVLNKIKSFEGDLVIDKFVRDEEFIKELNQTRDVLIIYLYASPLALKNRYNSRRLTPDRIPFEIIDCYPFIEGESTLFPPISEKQMNELLNSNIDFKSICDKVFEIDNTNLTPNEELELLKRYEI